MTDGFSLTAHASPWGPRTGTAKTRSMLVRGLNRSTNHSTPSNEWGAKPGTLNMRFDSANKHMQVSFPTGIGPPIPTGFE